MALKKIKLHLSCTKIKLLISSVVFKAISFIIITIIIITILTCNFICGCCNYNNNKSSDKFPSNNTNKIFKIGLIITPKGLNDKGFNELAYKGLSEATSKIHNISAIIIEPKDLSNPISAIEFFAKQNFDLIIALGVAFINEIQTIAPKYKNTPFVIIDYEYNRDNIIGISFREHEASFLCGVLAANFTKTKKVGFVGGIDIPVIKRFEVGFRQGVEYISKDIEIEVRYISNDFSGFNNPELAQNIALYMYKNGVDVILPAAGASSIGVYSAAVKTKSYAFGVDTNQDYLYPGRILTSIIKRVDLVVENVIYNFINYRNINSLNKSYGIAEGALDLSDFKFTAQIIGEENINLINFLKSKIVSGKLIIKDK